jgi:hypothetical protein
MPMLDLKQARVVQSRDEGNMIDPLILTGETDSECASDCFDCDCPDGD